MHGYPLGKSSKTGFKGYANTIPFGESFSIKSEHRNPANKNSKFLSGPETILRRHFDAQSGKKVSTSEHVGDLCGAFCVSGAKSENGVLHQRQLYLEALKTSHV